MKSAGAELASAAPEAIAGRLRQLFARLEAVASELRDALDLRHRMPMHWAAVQTGRVDAWKARRIVRLTGELTLEECLEVDRVTIAKTLGLPFGRANATVEAAIIAVDPVAHDQRQSLEAERRYVATGRPSDRFGLRTMIARASAEK